MRIIDCDARYGADVTGALVKPCEDAAQLLGELDKAGVGEALVYRQEVDVAGVPFGEAALLSDTVRSSRLHAVATILPTLTGEFPEPAALESWLGERGVKALRLSPEKHRYTLSRAAIGDTLEEASRLQVPVHIDTANGVTIGDVERLINDFPMLRICLTYQDCWPSARLLYPLVKGNDNIHISLTAMFTQDGVEDFVNRFGAGCLAYGSGFPAAYMGANLLMVRHARLSDAAREAILGLNTARWIERC